MSIMSKASSFSAIAPGFMADIEIAKIKSKNIRQIVSDTDELAKSKAFYNQFWSEQWMATGGIANVNHIRIVLHCPTLFTLSPENLTYQLPFYSMYSIFKESSMVMKLKFEGVHASSHKEWEGAKTT